MSFTVFRSSAGSGKTFTLVKEYLKIVLNNPFEFNHVLAITFTNKAAAEMKERILQALQALSPGTEDGDSSVLHHLLPQLIAETGLSAEEVAQRASRALELILHHYSDFAIGTIDAFSHRIIRSFAFDFGLPVQFNVELEIEDLLISVVDLLLDRVGNDEALTRFLTGFLEVKMGEEKGYNIEKTLVQFAKVLFTEDSQEHLALLRDLTLDDFIRIARTLYEQTAAFEKEAQAIGQDAVACMKAAGIAPACFFQGNKGIGNYFTNLSTGHFDKITPNSYVQSTVNDDHWTSKKAPFEVIQNIDGIKNELTAFYHKIRLLLDQRLGNYILNKLVAKTIYPLAVLNELERILDAFKKQNNLVHISEFNSRISAVVMNEPVPFIYERLGEKFHHLMIDEFQDTSRLQWQNFVPLLENALSSGYFNLVVGDGKQAIYRWRNGDVDQFTRLPELIDSEVNPMIRQRETVLKNHFNVVTLAGNYRSKCEIVEFNNRFFRYLTTFLDERGKAVYRDLEQTADPQNQGGLLSIRFLEIQKNGSDFANQNFEAIRTLIAESLADGFALRDIALLCRSNDQAGSIARMLTEQGIPVVSSESLLLTQSPEVNFLTGLIRFLYEPESPVNVAELAVYLHRSGKLAPTSLQEILQQLTLASGHGQALIGLMARHGIEFRKEELLILPVYDLAEKLIRLFGLSSKPDPYVRFFLGSILRFISGQKHSAPDFLEWWEEQQSKLSVVIPEGYDAVKILTIHKAKGLQFPVVIFPFATETRRMTRDHLWVNLPEKETAGLKTAYLPVSRDMEETIFCEQYLAEEQQSMLDLVNLLYVVMTRPQERLHVLTMLNLSANDKMKSLPAFFFGFLQSNGLWEEHKDCYEFGNRHLHSSPTIRKREDIVFPEKMVSASWRDRVRVRQRAPEMWNMENPMGNIHFGNQLHTILGGIRHHKDAQEALRHAFTSGLAAPEEKQQVTAVLQQVLTHPALSSCYRETAEVKTEPEILLPDGHVFRPDRVVLQGRNAILIEYKTGKKSLYHREQLLRYEELLLQMGYDKVKKLLVYLYETIEVVEI